MPFTAQECIDDARDQHRTFTERHTPDSSLLRCLNSYARTLYFLTHKRNPDLFVATQNIPFPLANFDLGYDLSGLAMLAHREATINYTNPDIKRPLTIVPVRNRFGPGQGPAAYIEDETLIFLGIERDWSDVTSVDFKYVPQPTPSASVTSNVDLPDAARRSCSAELASFMAMRGGMEPQDSVDVNGFLNARQMAEADYLDEIGRQRRATTFVVREVW